MQHFANSPTWWTDREIKRHLAEKLYPGLADKGATPSGHHEEGNSRPRHAGCLAGLVPSGARIPAFVELGRKIRKNIAGIETAMVNDLSMP